MEWSLFLFVLKWILLGLVYLVLILLLIGVAREMRLRVLQSGTDPNVRPGSLIPLQPETSIGAQSDNTLVLRDKFVSGHHARLRWDGISWWVEDLNSTNGTFINRQRVIPGAPAAVAQGAVIEMGDMAFEMMD
ncbi:MAG: FHA domain-containing protein [Chloroflexi bacterium]|nr:FHA domain-containing protein [Chloroflexota bacterium]